MGSTGTVPDLHALFPLFQEEADTPAMIKHGMTVVKEATEFLNPGQIPIMAVDQPLFALAKYIQWAFVDDFGSKKFVVMLGGLHTEQAVLHCLGNLLDGSGWTTALAEADVVSAGIAQSILRGKPIVRARFTHQVTLAVLHILQQQAYQSANVTMDFEEWKAQQLDRCTTFHFWDMIMQCEAKLMIFVRAHRTKDFPLYVTALENLVSLFFILGHPNYARWCSVHIHDMYCLEESVEKEFLSGNWVVSKTKRWFSSIPMY